MTTDAEELNEVVKLAMDIAADSNRCPDRLNVGLL